MAGERPGHMRCPSGGSPTLSLFFSCAARFFSTHVGHLPPSPTTPTTLSSTSWVTPSLRRWMDADMRIRPSPPFSGMETLGHSNVET